MEIRPFRGWRYTEQAGDLSDLIAPPYDVLSAEQKQQLLDKSEKNIVAVDLPVVPAKTAGPDEVYQAAADMLARWKDSGAMSQEDAPAIYVYHQTYTWAGKTYTREALLTGVRATELGEDVIPHEHTFSGPKEDRLKLTRATDTQLSPIFGFYSDPSGDVRGVLKQATESTPAAEAEMNGVKEQLWVVSDAETIGKISGLLKDTPAYIADGHHRYTTAMNYAKSLREAGQIDADHETNFVMFALVAREDEGLLVLPTHRVVGGLAEDFCLCRLREKLGDAVEIQRVEDDDIDLTDADRFLETFGPHVLAIAYGDDLFTCKLIDPDAMKQLAPEQCDAWRDLDVAILHELIMNRGLAGLTTENMTVDYTPDGQAARDAVRSGQAEIAFILQHTPVPAVQDVADAGESMPHKSTYFYPKLATGMVLKPLN
ncbi:MAG: DUF1015 domain-containing protein [Phycisphaerae bacterium]